MLKIASLLKFIYLNGLKQTMPDITRFAPSPTGELHLGHAYSALCAFKIAEESEGEFLLRIEDIDKKRCREEYVKAIQDDLLWLGLKWSRRVRRQSHHLNEYKKAINQLNELGLIYPCFCTRSDIKREIDKVASAPHGVFENIYPGTCKRMSKDEQGWSKDGARMSKDGARMERG